MGGFFNMDGAFFKFGNILADIMILSLVWIVFSIPLFTIGASTTALFYVTTRRISDREGYVMKDFISSFKSNFKQSTKIWLLWCVLYGIVISNIYMLANFDFDPRLHAVLLPVQVIILIELFITSIYLFPITARFEMSFRQTIKTSFFMANKHLLTTVTAIATAVAIVLSAAMFFEPILLVGMGLYAYATSHTIMGVFKKYRPEMDEDHFSQELAPMPDIEEADPLELEDSSEDSSKTQF